MQMQATKVRSSLGWGGGVTERTKKKSLWITTVQNKPTIKFSLSSDHDSEGP
jgi:hypothetical protein